MARYLTDTFKCASLTNDRQLMIFCAVATLFREATFLISCIKCQWDAVRHFLGCRRQSPKAPVKRVRVSPCESGTLATINYYK